VLSFGLDRPAVVRITLVRGSRTVARMTRAARAGTTRLAVGPRFGRLRLRRGRYLLAVEAPGGESSSARLLTVR
jgi:hypothetical protein